jgi:hypothetical protein
MFKVMVARDTPCTSVVCKHRRSRRKSGLQRNYSLHGCSASGMGSIEWADEKSSAFLSPTRLACGIMHISFSPHPHGSIPLGEEPASHVNIEGLGPFLLR